ncbi:MAG: hypothetical protein ABJD53_01905 [Gammaproteobacteria bacterium]
MSSSSLKIILLGVLGSGTASAAQVYIQPIASIGAEENSNLDLAPGPNPWVAGYLANMSTLFGISTPNSSTTIRPRLEYRDYPQDSANNRLEGDLELNSYYRSQRSRGSVYLGYEHRDEFNAELSHALYNDIGPTSPTSPETGRTQIGATRTNLIFLPDYSYNVTERLSAGVSAIYQQLKYSPQNIHSAIDFRYYQAKAYVRWAVDQRTDLTVGGFGSTYEATHFQSHASSGGGSLAVNTSWTPLFTTSGTLVFQHTNVNSQIPTLFRGSETPWGLMVSAAYKAPLNQFRLDAGRMITPSGGGGIYVNEQLQFQYTRSFTPRLDFTGAAIALRTHGLTSNVSGDDRTYSRTVLDLKYMMTRTFFVQGGYQFFWQKYELDPESANNNRLYIRFGYQGFGPRY